MPSIVVIFLPSAAETGVPHERTGLPSRCTVHAPHSWAPQPNFVPVMPTVSRIAQSNGVLGSTSTLWVLPLMFRRAMLSSQKLQVPVCYQAAAIMLPTMLARLCLFLFVLLVGTVPASGLAQEFPNRPVRIVVP